MNSKDLIARLSGVTRSGEGWQAKCPAHEDGRASLSIADGEKGIVLKCHAGCTVEAITGAMGLRVPDLFNDKPQANGKPQIVATYPYHDEEGTLLFEVCRMEPKTFRQRRPDGNGGWVWSLKDVRRVPFHLPQLLPALKDERPVYVVEGEKDVLRMEREGFAATCNAGGAGKWGKDFHSYFHGAKEIIIIADKDEPGRKHATQVRLNLSGRGASVRQIELPDINGKTVKDASDFFDAGGAPSELDTMSQGPGPTELEVGEAPAGARTLAEVLKECRFNPDIEPPPLRPIYTLTGIPVCTPGNITTITAAVKSGKSAVIGAMEAAAMPHQENADLLGFDSTNEKEMALLKFDSEQSPADFWHCEARALRRVGLQKPPPWLYPYCLTGKGHKRGWELVLEAIRIARDNHPGIHSILLDGAADFVADVNDAEESNDFVAQLHDIAIVNDCTIVAVIHFNPGSDKSRGHLGSQLERKAESNLALEKDASESTIIYSAKNRHAGIPRHKGPRFAWGVEARMHVSVASRGEIRDSEKREALRAMAEDIFEGHPSMRYSDIESALRKKFAPTTAERKLTAFRKLAIITRSTAGLYVLSNVSEAK